MLAMILACCASVLSHVTSYTSQPAPTTTQEVTAMNPDMTCATNDDENAATTCPARPTPVKRTYEEEESDSPVAKRLRIEDDEKTNTRCVRFSTAQVLSFGVELGECTIPGDTGFPLGMEQKHFREEWFDLSTIKEDAKSHEARPDPEEIEDDTEDDTEDDMSNDGQEGTEKTKSKKKNKKKRIGFRSVAKEIRLDRLEDAGVTYDAMTVYGHEAYPILVSRLAEVAKQKREKRRKKQHEETLRRMQENVSPPTKRPAQEDHVESTAKRHQH